MSILVAAGADLEARDKDGGTPLFNAAYRGRTQAVTALLKAGANPNVADNRGCTALHIAAAVDSAEIAQELLQCGADVNATTNKGHTPLELALQRGHELVARVLVRAGAKIPTRDYHTDKKPQEVAMELGMPSEDLLLELLKEKYVLSFLEFVCCGWH